MLRRDVTIGFKIGIHGRPAALLAQCAREFGDTRVSMCKDGKSVDARSLIGLLSLGIGEGSVVTIETDGPQEEAALDAVAELILQQPAKER